MNKISFFIIFKKRIDEKSKNKNKYIWLKEKTRKIINMNSFEK
jgi:hypothetical protein